MAESINQYPSLANQLLVSMPQLDDPNFAKTVILVCQHSEDGAMGIIINRLTEHCLGDIFDQLALPITTLDSMDAPVYHGGPVHQEIGLVVHNDCENQWDSTLAIGDKLRLTTSRDILGAMASGSGPRRAILGLGYAGWGPGQLEEEIKLNSWFSTPPDPDIIFNHDVSDKWRQAGLLLGIDYYKLSSQVGHA